VIVCCPRSAASMFASLLQLKRARLTLTESGRIVHIVKDPTQICGGGTFAAILKAEAGCRRRARYPEGVRLTKQTAKRDRHSEIVEQRARKSAAYRKGFERTLHRIDLAIA
jgi:hypothetical protein